MQVIGTDCQARLGLTHDLRGRAEPCAEHEDRTAGGQVLEELPGRHAAVKLAGYREGAIGGYCCRAIA